MPIVPAEWSVVILGAWNRAILTPSGISKRLFGLPVGTQVEVMVPLDVLAPFKVKHGDTSVVAASDRLIINPSDCTYANMGKAMEVGRTALGTLPETPVSAAGYNFKFVTKKSVPALARVVDHKLDSAFADRDLPVVSRSISRSVGWRDGEIRIAVSQEADESYAILLNFHKESDSTGTLREWLSVPLDEARKQVDVILYECLSIPEGAISHAGEDE